MGLISKSVKGTLGPASPLHEVEITNDKPLTSEVSDGEVQPGLKIQGSLIAAREIHREMLDFAAVHDRLAYYTPRKAITA